MEFISAIGSSIVVEIAKPALARVGRQLGYLFSFESNLELLRKKIVELEDVRTSLQRRLDGARTGAEHINDKIKDWLREVEKITRKANDFLGVEAQKNVRCSCGAPCPNWVLRYRLSRKAKKTVPEIDEHIKRGSEFRLDSGFYPTSHRPTINHLENREYINHLENGEYEAFNTRDYTLKQVMDVLENSSTRRVGIYGMAGVGKTMLAKAIATKAKESLFSLVIFITVSQNPNIPDMQEKIANQLHLKFQENSTDGRAAELRHRLKKEDKVLIVLDDLWKSVELRLIGICFDELKEECKMILTSRDLKVLETHMEVEKSFLVPVLNHAEATCFFRKIVGNEVQEPDFESVGSELIRECAGLPLAIKAVALAVKHCKLHCWKDALKQLKESSSPEITGVDAKVSGSIMLSYNFLKNNEDAQKLLLFCSLHGEDEEISVEVLMRCGLGFRLFKDIYNLEEARNRVRSLLDVLKDKSLLLRGVNHDTVKMHDVIRDVIINIPLKSACMYNYTDLAKFERDELRGELKNSTAISLLGCDSDHLIPQRLECPQLELFLRFTGNERWLIPDRFFEKVNELRVLYLTSVRVELLPAFLNCLQNVRVLCLHDCELQDIALIGKLKNLEVLDLSWSRIEQLPKEIGELMRLQLLSLEHCPNLKVIPLDIILSLTRLEELCIEGEFIDWEIEGLDKETSNSCLAKLRSLTLQYSQKCSVPDSDSPIALFNEKVTFPSLEVLKLCQIGLRMLWPDQLPISYFQNLRCLSVWCCNSLKYLLTFAVFRSLERLEFLEIKECRDMEVLLAKDPASDEEGRPEKILFSQLNYLVLSGLPNLKRLCAGNFIEYPPGRKLVINNCPVLGMSLTMHGRIVTTFDGELEEM